MDGETIIEGRDFIRLECLVEEHARNLEALKKQWDEYEDLRKEEYNELNKRMYKIENLLEWLKESFKVHNSLHAEMRTQEGIEIGKIKEKMVIYIGVATLMISLIIQIFIKLIFK